jgi:hypothetical protein
MRPKPSVFFIIFAVAAISVAGEEPARVRVSELSKQSFTVGELKITIKRFWPGSLLSRVARVEVRVENLSSAAATFDPLRLSFVNEDNRQVSIRAAAYQAGASRPGYGLDIVVAREVAPRAYIKEFYAFDGRVRLPARLFYEGKQLALIVK